jgi:putative hemolysin
VPSGLRKLLPKVLLQTDLSEAQVQDGFAAFEAVDSILRSLNIEVEYRRAERERIPAVGKCLIIANHPISTISGLALLRLIGLVRSDVKILAASSEFAHESLCDLVLPLGDDGKRTPEALAHLERGGALIIFPNRLGRAKARSPLNEERWSCEFLRIAELTQSSILPIHIKLERVRWMKQAAWLVDGAAQLLFKRIKLSAEPEHLVLRIGQLIEVGAYRDLQLAPKFKAKLLRKQLYRIPKDKPSLFATMEPVAHPESKDDLRSEIESCQRLGQTNDGKQIYLFRSSESSSLMREIGRLRELSFRMVGEGTGKRRDIDEFDFEYMHIVLWDLAGLEVVGAYRLKPCSSLAEASRMYTSTLITYNNAAQPILERGLELGRSFVQPKYWGSRSLDYLWSGIAAYLRSHPEIRYLLGAVSISNSFSREARDLIVGYYSRYYSASAKETILTCKRPYSLDESAENHLTALFNGLDVKQAFVVLKEQLGLLGHSVPTLYKQYSELCELGGALFHGFNVDPSFQGCIDGLVVVDLTTLRPLKRKRYGLLEHEFLDRKKTDHTKLTPR